MNADVIGVVIPHFEDETRLHRTLHALARQRGVSPTSLHVVVADDGSASKPTIPDTLGYRCELVTQPNRGFRAAAARNLGARTILARGSVAMLVFLDGDMVPAPDFLGWMRNAIAGEFGRDVLVVGARRHADFTGASVDEVLRWVATDEIPAQRRLVDPAWLADGYERTHDLRTAGDEDFRLVISACLGIDTALWRRVGGFDESLVGYGGEDWELAWRCYLAGAELRHVPQAIAWHDGPDFAGRPEERNAVKNAESLALARRIPLPSTRGLGVVQRVPRVTIRLSGRHDPAHLMVCAQSLLAEQDAALWLIDETDVPESLCADPRIWAGPVPTDVLASTQWQVDLAEPAVLLRPWAELLVDVAVAGKWSARRTRSIATGTPPDPQPSAPWLRPIPVSLQLERHWGGW